MNSISMTVEQMLDTFKTLCGTSEYYKANIVVSANGKVMPIESIAMNAAMSTGDTQPLYTFCLSAKEDKKEDCVHVFAQDVEAGGLSDVEPIFRALTPRLSIKVGDIVTIPAGLEYAGYIGRVEGIGTLHKINKTKRSIDFDISEKFSTVAYKDGNCIDCLLWVKLKNIPMLQKFHVFEVELLPADYGDIIRLNETGNYGTLDSYVITGTDQYKRVDGLYAKVKGIDVTPIYTYVPLMSSITNLSNPDLQRRRNDILENKNAFAPHIVDSGHDIRKDNVSDCPNVQRRFVSEAFDSDSEIKIDSVTSSSSDKP